MSFTVIYTTRAAVDMDNGYDWYERQQPGLDDRFINAVIDAVDSITRNPQAYPAKYKSTREIRLPPFPYIVIYLVEGNLIYIQAVFPAKMNPRKKYRG